MIREAAPGGFQSLSNSASAPAGAVLQSLRISSVHLEIAGPFRFSGLCVCG